MLIVVYIYETKKQARVPAFSSLFYVWLLLGTLNLLNGTLRKATPSKGNRGQTGKGINARQKTPHANFFWKKCLSKVEISTKTKENTHALSETKEEHTRARASSETEKER